MPDAGGNFKGISLGGKAAEAWERIFGRRCRDCGGRVAPNAPEALCPRCASGGYD